MLTASQCEVVAAILHGEILCLPCAKSETSALTIEKAEQGLSHGGGDLSLLIRYELDEYNGERASEHADEEAGDYSDNPDAWNEAFDNYPGEHCGSCGTEL